MSGIVAAFGPGAAHTLRGAAHALAGRGPRGLQEERLADGGLAATIGAPAEARALAWDRSRRWCVACDGELLNARSLFAELGAWDEAPDDASSAAIIAEMFRTRGFEGGLERLAGDVAILAWDAAESRLWAARDRAGMRPLHHQLVGTALCFASDAAALPGAAHLDAQALSQVLAFDGPVPPRTLFDGRSALPPGWLATWSAGAGLELRSWWSTEGNPAGADGARYRWARSASFAVELAFQQRAQVEAPVAVALSGGVYAEALLAGVAARRRDPVLALTLQIEGAPDETARAAEIARRHRARHLIVPLRFEEIPALMAEISASVDPLLAPEALAWHALARAAWANDCEVMLNGVGGSSLFGGTPLPVLDRASSVPGLGLLGRVARGGQVHRRLWSRLHAPTPDPAAWEPVDALTAGASGDPTGVFFWLQRQLSASGIHATVDRAAALHGVRVSTPYADASLVRLISSFPIGHLVQVRRPRGLFLDAMKDRIAGVPPEHAPMAVPVEAWLAHAPPLDARSLLSPDLSSAYCDRWLDPGAPVSARWALMALAGWRALRRTPA